jgi:hypothetical protein
MIFSTELFEGKKANHRIASGSREVFHSHDEMVSVVLPEMVGHIVSSYQP